MALGANKHIVVLDLGLNLMGEAGMMELSSSVVKATRPFLKRLSLDGFQSNIKGTHVFLESLLSAQASVKVILLFSL